MRIDAISADFHWGHKNIIQYCQRPFTNTWHMQEELVERHNSVVGPKDTILYLGDLFFLSSSSAKQLVDRLNGKKYLLRGNHDRRFTDACFLDMGFETVFPNYFQARLGVHPVYYSHYPFAGYSADKRYDNLRPPNNNTVIVHGHTHEKTRLTDKNTVHVGVDAWDFRPARFEEVEPLVAEAYRRKQA